jgi:HAMP domain-containing protein
VNETLLRLAVSALLVAVMIGVAAWARIARPVAPLDEAAARELMAGEFPDLSPDYVWIAGDGAGAIGRAGDTALVIYRLGDSWVARSMPWRLALVAPVKRGRVLLKLRDPAAPMARLAVSGVTPWPPEFQSEELAA